jgi:hypothetical protein
MDEFVDKVKGKYIKDGYFSSSHKIISTSEFASYSKKYQHQFSKCYNMVRFQTADSDWELFFYLIREGTKFNEMLTVRAFPKKYRIKSEGNIEKSYGRVNIYTNNRYLTHILEKPETSDFLKWLLRHNNDILLVLHNNLHYKAYIDSHKYTPTRALDMIKAMNVIKNKIYKKDVLEY